MLLPLPITAETVKRRIESGERVIFLDSRSPDEWEEAAQHWQLRGGIVGLLPSRTPY